MKVQETSFKLLNKQKLSLILKLVENMTEEESQLLEGTRDKFQVVELTKTTSDIKGASEIEIDHSLSQEYEVGHYEFAARVCLEFKGM